MSKIEILIGRLARICSRRDWDNRASDVWVSGLAVLQKKFGVVIYLSSFKPQGFIMSEQPTANVTTQFTEKNQ